MQRLELLALEGSFLPVPLHRRRDTVRQRVKTAPTVASCFVSEEVRLDKWVSGCRMFSLCFSKQLFALLFYVGLGLCLPDRDSLFQVYEPTDHPLPPLRCYSGDLGRQTSSTAFPTLAYELSLNNYLPDGCITYCDRYGNVFQARLTGDPNAGMSDQAILIKVVAKETFPADFYWFVRSLIKETPGYHVYLLLHTNKREGVTGAVPSEFQQLTVVVDEEDLQHTFPQNFQDGWFHGDYGAFYFYRSLGKARGYSFIWSFEDDVRYIGRSWGDFLGASYKYAIEQQHPTAEVVDYLTYFPICRPARWWPWLNSTIGWKVSFQDARWAHIMACGFSPKTIEAALAFISNSSVAYGEMFLPTLTNLLHHKSAWVKHPIFGGGDYSVGEVWNCDLRWTSHKSHAFVGSGSYHWTVDGYAPSAYPAWANSHVCHNFALMHKVMNVN